MTVGQTVASDDIQGGDTPSGWSAASFAHASEGMCDLLAAVSDLDAALGASLPVHEPASVLRLVARVRERLDLVEAAAAWDAP